MTTAQCDLQEKWEITYDRGVSLYLGRTDFLQRSDIQLVKPLNISTGTSGSAKAIDNYLPDMLEQISYWQIASERRSEEYQEEVIVLMPPKRQYTVDLEIHYLGRAKPLISIDEMDMDISGD